jgi:hypothetical protein
MFELLQLVVGFAVFGVICRLGAELSRWRGGD